MIVTIDPTTGDVIERIPPMDPAQIDARLDAAASAARAWGHESFEDRAALLRSVARRLREENGSLAATAVREMGKPIAQARAEVEKCAWALDYFAEHGAAMLAPQDAPSNAARSYVAFRPLGVLLAIMPWNFPYWQVFRAAAPALVAGNAVLLKHAANTTRCALEIARIFDDAGAPEGLFGVLLARGEEIDRIVEDPRIAAVTLTGSERAGAAVAAAAGKALKKCVLELGGSDPFVVLADADLAAAATTAVKARFQNNGESCIAAKRFIVEAPLYDEFLRRFVELAAAQVVGNPMEERVQIGPCARADLRDTVHQQVSETVAQGARAALGGTVGDGRGFFYDPTIVADVVPGMRMFDEEVFGPAAAVVRASDREHALGLANHSSFGLGSSVWTRDVAGAEDFGARVEAGAVFVNGMVASDPRLPFGGVKKSGYGRELSAFGIHEFVNIQTVWIA
ncbi:MAG: NAD-dependent succinate-semialdehyde dehydrogenase [Candidatus Eremiobacteraeota bacterium]|nr:NAD-dependent succinate-semialdehyde dehydrogenase [Candidatus Eremiobacteraeota bacterium]MBV8499477.1 NAD-dependent succinate-semialdehyde dehydrogenase [Candidatus Eremiobacteraeota bacterium]